MIRKRGLILATIGLLSGVALGLLIISAQSYVGNLLVGLLRDEVENSCNCKFVSDPPDVSLLTLTARLKNARIVSENHDYLFFKDVRGRFSLDRIKERIILLSRLELLGGYADGIDPASPTYKFIDSITAPIPAEKDRPDRWKLKLQELSLDNFRFTQLLGKSSLQADNATLLVKRTPQNDFELTPAIGVLSLSGEKSYRIGGLSGFLHLSDPLADFKSLALSLPVGQIDSSFTIDKLLGNKLAGDFNFNVSSNNIPDPKIKYDISGQGNYSGTIESPSLTTSSVKIITPELTQQSLTPITINPNKISGGIKFQAKDLDLDRLKLGGVIANIVFSGTPTKPHIELEGVAEQSSFDGVHVNDIKYQINASTEALEVRLSQGPQNSGTLQANLTLSLKEQLLLKEPLLISAQDFEVGGFLLNGSFKSDSNVDFEHLQGLGSFDVSFGRVRVPVNIELARGILKARGAKGSFKSSIDADLLTSKQMQIQFSLEHLSDLLEGVKCTDLALSFKANADITKLSEASGKLTINRALLGCAPFELALKQRVDLELSNGNISLDGVQLVGSNSHLNLDGKLGVNSDLAINARGKLNLNSFIELYPDIDELSGPVTVNLSLNHANGINDFGGTLVLNDGVISSEEGHFAADEVNGSLKLSGSSVIFEEVNGNLNQGKFKLDGTLYPLRIEDSLLSLSFNDVVIEPGESMNAVLGGILDLKPSESGHNVIGGTINVDSAELQKDLNLLEILRLFIGFGKETPSAIERQSKVSLDIRVKAERNVFLFTNWLGAELKGETQILGSLSEPAVKGKLEVISGWFGVRDRRFDITSAEITLTPLKPEPSIRLLSETNIASTTGDNVLVFLEARGPISNPKIQLTSDAGLSQKELLNLITGTAQNLPGNRLMTPIYLNPSAGTLPLGEIPLFRDDQSLNVGKLFSQITTIDSLVIEPSYNSLRGGIEPSLVATKRITDKLYLRGENFFSSEANQSILRLIFSLSSRLTLSGVIDAQSTQANNPFGVDLTFTVLSKQKPFIEVELHGNSHLEDSEILHALRIGEQSQIKGDNLPLLKKRLSSLYADQGYLNGSFELDCKLVDESCSKLTMNINEGPRSYVSAIIMTKDPLPAEVADNFDLTPSGRHAATKEYLEQQQVDLIRTLRSEGYIAARVKASYLPNEDSNCSLQLELTAGKPVTFVFSGNSRFSADEFLESINLFKRKQPFGNNTINILVQNIERRYREAGYLFVQIDHRLAESQLRNTDRLTYLIEINEGGRYYVDQVEFEGQNFTQSGQLRKLLDAQEVVVAKRVLSPRFALAEEIEANLTTIRNILLEAGFQDSKVSYELIPHDAASAVTIRYKINEGATILADRITLEGVPKSLELPPKPTVPFSIYELNLYSETLFENLQQVGYLRPQIRIKLNGEHRSATLSVLPGSITQVADVQISGLENVAQDLVLKNILLKAGDPWSQTKISKTQLRLLRLGLFSKVEILPLDGVLNDASETLLVKLSERALQTLEVGTGLNSEYGLHIFGEASDRTLFMDGRSLALRLDSYYDSTSADISQGIASLRFADPFFLDSDFSLVEDLRFQKLDQLTQEFDLDRVSLASYLSRSWQDGSSISFGHTILHENLNNVSPDAIIGDFDDGSVRLGFLSGALNFDRRNDALNPRRGFSLGADMKLASEIAGSDASFYSLGARGSVIKPFSFLNQEFSLALNLRSASAWTFAGTDVIPISQRFYLGGRSSVRGFKENSMGPRGDQGSVIGGDFLFVGNTELRYLLTETFSVHSFMDTGNVFLMDRSLNFDDLRYSTGVGMRYLSPIGPIGFDLGHPLARENGESSLRIHFSVGTNF